MHAANEKSGNDGQDIGPWSSPSSARRSGRGASGAPSAVLSPLPKDTKSPQRDVKQASHGKDDEGEGAAMGWLVGINDLCAETIGMTFSTFCVATISMTQAAV